MIHLDHLIIMIITIMIIVGMSVSIDMIAHISIKLLIQLISITHFALCEKHFHTLNCEEGSLYPSHLCVPNYWGHDMPTHGVQ